MPESSHSPWWSLSSCSGLIILLVAVGLLYLPGLSGPFLFDDAPNIVDNTVLNLEKTSFLDWWAAAQSSGAGAFRRPVPMLSFALQAGDGSPAPSYALKLGNVALHALCGVLLYLIARNLLRGMDLLKKSYAWRWLPMLAAGFWLFNPLLVSTVLYPVQRMAQMTTLFSLLGLFTYTFYRARWSKRSPRIDEILAAALWLALCTVLAALSKENGVLLPALVAVFEVSLFCGRLAGAHNARLHAVTVSLFLLGLGVAGAMLLWQWDWILAGYGSREFTLSERLWTQGRLLWEYTGWFLVPRLGELGLFHDDILLSTGWFTPWTTMLAAVAWLMALTVGLICRQSFPWLLMAILFFLTAHSIESSVLALELVFEHRNYLPSVALALLLAAGVCALMGAVQKRGKKKFVIVAGPLLLSFFALSLLARANSWSSEMQLASATFARHPDSPRSAHFYSNTLIKAVQEQGIAQSKADEYLVVARHEFEALHTRRPDDLSALVMLYTLDSRYFSEVVEPERWLVAIESSVATTQLAATEYAAMRVFLACFADGFCEGEPERLQKIIETFSERHAFKNASAEISLLAMNQAQRPRSEINDYLLAAIEESPDAAGLHYQLIQTRLDAREYAAAHLAIVDLLGVDENRRQLSILDRMFKNASQP